MRTHTYLTLIAAAILFFSGASFVSAQQVSTEALMAQISNLLLLVQDLQKQLSDLKSQQSAAQASSVTAPPITAVSVTVLSPDNGETFVQGQQNRISWNGGTGKVEIGLVDKSFDTTHTVLGWISLNEQPDGTLVWNGETVSDLSGTEQKPLASLSAGPYKIIAVSAGATGAYCVTATGGCNYDLSNAYFTVILSAASNSSFLTSCAPSANAVATNELVTWAASASNGQPPYTYSWSGTDGISALPVRSSSDGRFLDVVYYGAGRKMAGVDVRDAAGKESSAVCNTLTVTPAPPPLRITSPNGGESFVMTRTSDPTQFIKVAWESNGLKNVRTGDLRVAFVDTFGRECAMANAPRTSTGAYISVFDGYPCERGEWGLAPGQYKVKVYLSDKPTSVFDTSDGYVTLTEPVQDTQAITASLPVVASGSSVAFHLLAPENTLRAALSVSCPLSIRATAANLCNHYTDITSYATSATDYTATFVNSSTEAQDVAVNFYVYLPNNPNYGRGVPTHLTVLPPPVVNPNYITVLRPNGGETIRYGDAYAFTFRSTQAGVVDLTLLPDPPIDADGVCPIGTDIPATSGTFTFTIPANGVCAKNPKKPISGSYKLLAILRDGSTKLGSDQSDAAFSILAPSPVAP